MGRQRRRRGRGFPGNARDRRAADGHRQRLPGHDGGDLGYRARARPAAAAVALDLARGQVAGPRAEVFRSRGEGRRDVGLDRQVHVGSVHHRTAVPEARPLPGGFPEEFPVRAAGGRRGRREEGFVLFLAILVLLIATVAGLATMLATSTDLTLSGNETKVSKVFYAADSGIGYSAAKLRTDVNYQGGQMPVGISSNYASAGSGDIQVTITRPLVIGQQIHPGDPILAQGTIYGPPQTAGGL